jgi:hypothetical protein
MCSLVLLRARADKIKIIEQKIIKKFFVEISLQHLAILFILNKKN